MSKVTLTVKKWGVTVLFLLLQSAFVQEPGQRVCTSQLTKLGAQPPDADWLPAVWEVPLGKFLPFLATIEGVKDLSPTSFGYGPPGSSQREEVTDPAYSITATCSGHLLFLSKNSGNYLVTIDLLRKEKLSGVGGLFGVPSQAWRVDDAVYAINLFEGDINLEGLILNVTTGEVLFYEGPARFGDLKVALVVPGKGVLLENYSWGAPSMRNSVNLLLFELANGARRRTPEGMPSCLVKLPPNAYAWRFTLRAEGIVLTAQTSERTGALPAPSPTPTPSPNTPSAPVPPSRPPPAPGRTPPASGDATDRAMSGLVRSCQAVADGLLN